MSEPNREKAGRSRQIQTLGYLGIFADPPPGHVLVKARLAAQLNSFHAQPRPEETAKKCRLIVSSNRLPRARHSV